MKTEGSVEEQKDSRKPVRNAIINKMTMGEVSEHWDRIYKAVLEGLGAESSASNAMNIMNGVLAGTIAAWSILYKDGEDYHFIGALTTAPVYDRVVDKRMLSVCSLRTYRTVDPETVTLARDTLYAYAKGIGCTHIVAGCAHPKLLSILPSFGYEVRTILLKEIP